MPPVGWNWRCGSAVLRSNDLSTTSVLLAVEPCFAAVAAAAATRTATAASANAMEGRRSPARERSDTRSLSLLAGEGAQETRALSCTGCSLYSWSGVLH